MQVLACCHIKNQHTWDKDQYIENDGADFHTWCAEGETDGYDANDDGQGYQHQYGLMPTCKLNYMSIFFYFIILLFYFATFYFAKQQDLCGRSKSRTQDHLDSKLASYHSAIATITKNYPPKNPCLWLAPVCPSVPWMPPWSCPACSSSWLLNAYARLWSNLYVQWRLPAVVPAKSSIIRSQSLKHITTPW